MLAHDRLAKATTKVRDRAMTRAVLICTVTASAEQIPRICFEMGLLSHRADEMALYEGDRVSFIGIASMVVRDRLLT